MLKDTLKPVKIISGFDNTRFVNSDHPTGKKLDISSINGQHDVRIIIQDLNLATQCGITHLRICAPWHRISKTSRYFDWRYIRQVLEACTWLGIKVIVDLVHHTAVPDYINHSFADPLFVDEYLAFVRAFINTFPSMQYDVTLINEPEPTAHLAAGGIWRPQNADYFVMIKNMAMAMSKGAMLFKQHNPAIQIFHTDPAIHYRSNDPILQNDVYYKNNVERFEVLDLLFGLINPSHLRYQHLLNHGFDSKELAFFCENPVQIDTLALDYYLHCEIQLGKTHTFMPALGLRALVMQYVERYCPRFPNLNFAIGEVNVRGTVDDLTSWFYYCVKEAELLQQDIVQYRQQLEIFNVNVCPLHLGIYPLVDTFGWTNLMTHIPENSATIHDPQGIFWIDHITMHRNHSIFSEAVMKYATGQITSDQIPYRGFDPDMHNYPGELLAHLLPHN